MQVDIYNLKNEIVGKTELPDKIFGEKWRPALVAQVLRAQLANKRRPWAHAKTRAEVRGGGKKPWRQKGTGRARHGSIRSPLWVGGGKSHGPSKERDYSQKINKKMKKAALFSVLSKKLKKKKLIVFDNFQIEAPKTKILAKTLKDVLSINRKRKNYDALLVVEKENKIIFRAASNLPKTKAEHPNSLNIYDVLNYKNVLLSKEAAKEIAEHYK